MKLSRPVTRGSLISWDKSLCIFCQKESSRETVLIMTNADATRSLLLRLGSFHTALTVMCAIGKHMSDSGLAEVWTESVVFGENTTANNLLAKSCNHAVRAHKLTYEALLRILWPQFIEWLTEQQRQIDSSVEERICTLIGLSEDRDDIDKIVDALNSIRVFFCISECFFVNFRIVSERRVQWVSTYLILF